MTSKIGCKRNGNRSKEIDLTIFELKKLRAEPLLREQERNCKKMFRTQRLDQIFKRTLLSATQGSIRRGALTMTDGQNPGPDFLMLTPHLVVRRLGGRGSAPMGAGDFSPSKVRGCKSAGATCMLIRMPELPDIAAYISALEPRIVNQPIERVRLASAFLLRTVQPPVTNVEGRTVRELRRIGKRIAIGVDGDLWLVLHLMIAGRLHWRPPGAKLSGRQNLAAFDFPGGSLMLTEAGTKRRASLHVLTGEAGLRSVDPGGIDIFASDFTTFRAALTAENRTLKRALTDPRLLSGIGNAYSDEILHAAQLSPITLTHKLEPRGWERLFAATRHTLELWIDRLRAESGGGFPEKVTAFRKNMAVHGRYGEPCPRCGEKIQRIRYADNETNYCARCQTGGKLLADRSLSRLLRSEWPRTLEELEALKRR